MILGCAGPGHTSSSASGLLAGRHALLIPYMPHDSIAQIPALAVADARPRALPFAPRVCRAARRLPGRPTAARSPAAPADGKTAAPSGIRAATSSSPRRNGTARALVGRRPPRGLRRQGYDRDEGGGPRAVAHVAGVARAWSPDGQTAGRHASRGPRARAARALRRAPRPADRRKRLVGRIHARRARTSPMPNGRDGLPQIAAVAGGAAAAVHAATAGGTWSRDGRYAALVTVLHPRAPCSSATMRAPSMSAARCPTTSRARATLAWLGDGSRLLYDGSSPGIPQLWAMGTDGAGADAADRQRLADLRSRRGAATGARSRLRRVRLLRRRRDRDRHARRARSLGRPRPPTPGDHTNDGSPKLRRRRHAGSRWPPTIRRWRRGARASRTGRAPPVAADGAGAGVVARRRDDRVRRPGRRHGLGEPHPTAAPAGACSLQTVKGVRSLAWPARRGSGSRTRPTRPPFYLRHPGCQGPWPPASPRPRCPPGCCASRPTGPQIAFAADNRRRLPPLPGDLRR